MADIDYYSQEIQPQGGGVDYFSKEIGQTPADANLGPLKFNAQHPYLNALVVNPAIQAYKSISPVIDAGAKAIGFPQSEEPGGMTNFGRTIDNNTIGDNAPMASKVIGDIAGGATKGALAAGMSFGNPLGAIGAFGALSGADAYGKGRPVLPAVAEGAASAIPQLALGAVGGRMANAAVKPLANSLNPLARIASKYAPNIGTAAGMGGASAAQEAISGGDPLRGLATGATFGALNPMGNTHVTPEQHDSILDKGGELYRKILAPGKGEINSVEIKSGKNLDDFYKIAAQEALPLNKSADNKLDTKAATAQLRTKIEGLDSALTDALKSQPHQQFDLEDLRDQAKADRKGKSKTAKDFEDGSNHIDNYIDAEIRQRGQTIDGSDLNELKRGMWRTSYDPLSPNSHDAARSIGFAAKNAIENAYKDKDIQGLNRQMGDYATLDALLDKAHGRVVDKGKLGKYVAQLTGLAIGHHIPLAGDLGGGWLGGKVNEFMTDPARLTGNWAKKLQGLKIVYPDTAIDPEILNTTRQRQQEFAGQPERIGNTMPDQFNPFRKMLETGSNESYSGPAIQMPGQGRLPAPVQRPSFQGPQTPDIIHGFNPIARLPAPKNIYGDNFIMQPGEPAKGATVTPNIPSGQPAQRTGPNEALKAQIEEQKALEQARGNQGRLSGENIAKGLGVVTAVGAGSMFNPLNAQAAQVKNPERLQMPGMDYTKAEEGYQAHPYIDTKGNKTIGYGFKFDTVSGMLPKMVAEGKRGLTNPEADQIFSKLYSRAQGTAQNFAGEQWNNLNEHQQKALTDMAYNMGGKLNGFKNMKQAIEDGDFRQASKEIIHSNYFKEVKNRASRNAMLMAMQ